MPGQRFRPALSLGGEKRNMAPRLQNRWGRWAIITIMTIMLAGLPLVGILLAGKPVTPYLEFPPLTRYIQHAPFSGWIFGIFAIIDLLLIVSIGRLLMGARRQPFTAPTSRHRFPVWGWAGLIVMAGGWLLAWTRFPWFAPLQGHTFCLPWTGYILLVNGLCVRRSGRSLLTDAPGQFLLLIPVSALFWWFFEYLNRFVQNWYYTGVDDFTPLSYTLFASLAFATVLPAVLSTHRLLLTLHLFHEGLRHNLVIHAPCPRRFSTAVLAISCAGLLFLGIWPDGLFALLWVSPLILLSALQALGGCPTIFTPLRRGDWRSLTAAPLAALICGFFWELWNIGSLARWHYTVPYVDRYHLFAMPILGYGGYLPFGLECLAIGAMVMARHFLFPESEAPRADAG